MKTDIEAMQGLFDEVISELRKKIKEGGATAADFAVARALLRDNNITAAKGTGHAVEKLATELPFSGDDDDQPSYN